MVIQIFTSIYQRERLSIFDLKTIPAFATLRSPVQSRASPPSPSPTLVAPPDCRIQPGSPVSSSNTLQPTKGFRRGYFSETFRRETSLQNLVSPICRPGDSPATRLICPTPDHFLINEGLKTNTLSVCGVRRCCPVKGCSGGCAGSQQPRTPNLRDRCKPIDLNTGPTTRFTGVRQRYGCEEIWNEYLLNRADGSRLSAVTTAGVGSCRNVPPAENGRGIPYADMPANQPWRTAACIIEPIWRDTVIVRVPKWTSVLPTVGGKTTNPRQRIGQEINPVALRKQLDRRDKAARRSLLQMRRK